MTERCDAKIKEKAGRSVIEDEAAMTGVTDGRTGSRVFRRES